ncbi:MAG: hypothetical protein KJ882_01990 [Proteobacteria bacterium]|nr:hypothetical protein [Pseudomonadota bacterium]
MRSDFTLEELKKDSDPLSYVCHSVSKLKMIANVIQTNCVYTDRPPLEVFKADDVRAMGELIEDAAIEIETLVDIAEDQGHDLWHENRDLKGTLENLQAETTELKKQLEQYRLQEYDGDDIIRIDSRKGVAL